MPENAIPLVSCNAYTTKEVQYFPKIICSIQRGPRIILCFYVPHNERVIPTPVEYHIDQFIAEFPHSKPLCIDASGRNHGVQESVYIDHHDLNNAIIAACQAMSQDWKRDLGRQV